MNEILYQGRLVALTSPSEAILLESVAALECGHPLKRFVATMCAYSMDIQRDALPGPYTPEAAHAYARWLLMPRGRVPLSRAAGRPRARRALLRPARAGRGPPPESVIALDASWFGRSERTCGSDAGSATRCWMRGIGRCLRAGFLLAVDGLHQTRQCRV